MTETNDKNKTDLRLRSYRFSLAIIAFIDSLDKRDFSVGVIIKQLLRSATSIGANIIEAIAASSRKDFINFYHYALKSANETKYWLSLLKDSGKSETARTSSLISEVDELCKILAASLITLKQ